MLKVLILHGSPHKGNTYEVTMEFLKELGTRIETEVKHIFLYQENLELCMGCGNCVVVGEDKCPRKDRIPEIHHMMHDADVVIITTPIYSLQVTSMVKNFLERSAYIMHRPSYFGKYFMSISTQAYSGDKDVEKYLASSMHFLGFNIIPGLHITMGPGNEELTQNKEIQKKIDVVVNEFQKIEKKSKYSNPNMKDLMMFRLRRSTVNSKSTIEVFPRDAEYFQENDWLKKDYYYDVHLNPLMKATGKFFDMLGRRMIKKENSQI